jgi:hypothetical protein
MADGDIPPHEAFSLLTDPNRLDIIRVIAESTAQTLPFNELYRRSDFDDSGQFNYHLDKLVGPFLQKTADGYELRHAAAIAYRLAVSGFFSDRGEAELTTVDVACVECGADQLVAVYEGDRFWVRCGECERRAAVAPFPPQALAYYDPDHTPAAFDRYTMGTMLRAADNVCPWCGSPLSAALESADEGWPGVEWVIRRACDHCHGWIYTRLYGLLRFHPAVISFYYERGVDILGSNLWRAEALMSEQVTVDTDADSWTAVVTLRAEGDTLTLGLADDLSVSTVEVLTTPEST